MRLLLALSVIALHSGFPDGAPALVYQSLINGLFRLAVPVFAVISGFFFLGAMRSGRAGAYIGRILSLYAMWMVIYLPIYGPDFTSVGHAAQLFFFGYFHLWFLPGLAIGAMLVLVLRNRAVIAVAAVICAMTGLLLEYLTLSGRASIELDFYRNGLFVIFPFFASGWLLAGMPRPNVRVSWIALSLLGVVAESMWWYRVAGGGYGVDTMASLFLAAPLLFLGAGQIRGGWDGKRLASMAAFIYFIHVLIMITASRFGLEGNAKAGFVMAVSLALAWWLGAEHRRPVLRLLT
ncbi:acyltransferase family protein [Paracoccus sp. 1_MG-2023]|nr:MULTISPECIES: acyltransferase family protein [unclassified Paracoccus (in: a-proteobacteria)]MBU2957556.1 acyltransferase family protein [Paracoccus sp. C2R09]MDO6669784.1 acyltransferase family protein [Paracoccus sp. 1_MG-2023]